MAVLSRLVAFVLAALIVAPALTETREITPADSFEGALESLQPGDTLIVHEGTYQDTGRISLTVSGTAALPVVVRAAEGEARPHITRPAAAEAQNTINIEGASYVTIQGLEISSNGGDGINLNSEPSYITLEDLEIHDVDVGVNFRSSMHHITVRRNHIHHTGDDGGTGEGMYVGCNYAECAVTDSLIEGNWIHDTQDSTQGDGIEIKRGSHTNVIRDNVIHDTRYPCILLYGTEGNPRNIVEGNVMWSCGDSGIQAAADAVIRNNLILNSVDDAFNSQDHQDVTPANLEFVHNTIVGGDTCLRLSNWSNKEGLVLANNAIYCDGGYQVGSLVGVTIAGNVLSPSTSSLPSSGYSVGQSAAEDFGDAASYDVYPGNDSAVIDAGSAAHATATDFNGTPREGAPDAGAYTWSGTQNPGWTVVSGFKDQAATAPSAPQPPTGLRVE